MTGSGLLTVLVRKLAAPLLLTAVFAGSAMAQDSTDFFLRLNQVENQMREMSGQMERLQFENRRLQEQLKRFQEDVEFRFQESSGGGNPPPRQKRSDAEAAPAAGSIASAPSPTVAPSVGGGTQAWTPNAEPQSPVGQPLDLAGLRQGGNPAADIAAPVAGPQHQQAPQPAIPSVAATAPGDPRQGYQIAESFLRQQQYEQAEMGFRQFIQSHPRDQLVPDATYFLGESYYYRGRYREAAEQYLKLTTNFAKSNRAPEGLLRLGQSLEAMGARDQACATYSEVERKYPQASRSTLREGITNARGRAKCV